MAKKGLGSIKRFGPRYGWTVKQRLARAETEQKRKHRCPFCSYDKVRNQSVGIWLCGKCGAKFANKAYTVAKITPIKQETEAQAKEPVEEAA